MENVLLWFSSASFIVSTRHCSEFSLPKCCRASASKGNTFNEMISISHSERKPWVASERVYSVVNEEMGQPAP